MNNSMQSLGDVLECSNPQPSSTRPDPHAHAKEEQSLQPSKSYELESTHDKKAWQVSPMMVSGGFAQKVPLAQKRGILHKKSTPKSIGNTNK